MRKNIKKALLVGMGLLISLGGYPTLATAQSSSSNYRVEESFFGTGGEVDATSPNYRARQSAGALGVGSASSNNYDAVAGFNTPTDPFLEMYVTDADVDLGTLSDTTTSSGSAQGGDCNCSFSVRSYLTSDYVVLNASRPPTNENGYSLKSKTVQGAPSTNQGTEEFGMNVVDNTAPDIGANPKNQPDDTFADGHAESGYNIPNQFKYGIGDIIARSPTVSGNPGVGKTDYTISYIAKISGITPAGAYTMQHDLIVVALF